MNIENVSMNIENVSMNAITRIKEFIEGKFQVLHY